MAAPIIDSIDVDPPSVPPGGTVTVTIQAHDPDGGAPPKTYRGLAQLTDNTGAVVTGQIVFNVDAVPGDTIASYAILDTDNIGLVIVQDANSPNVFRVTVP